MDEETRARQPDRRELARALAVIALLFALPLGRALIDGESVLFAVDTATVQAPWSVTGAGEGVPRQPGQADQGTFFYPAYRATVERWRAGAIPLWNPLSFGGVPHLANPQTGALDPQVALLGLLEWIGGAELFDRGFAWLAWLRLVACGFGAFVFARRLGRTTCEAFVCAIGFAGAGHVVLWLNHSLGHVVPFLPWVLLAVDASDPLRPLRSLARTAALFASAILGGHPETAFAIGLVAGVWALTLAPAPRRLGLGGLALGTLACGVQLVPFVEYLAESAALAARELNTSTWDLRSLGIGLIVLALLRASARDGGPIAITCACLACAAVAWKTLPVTAWLAVWPDALGAFGSGPGSGYRGPGHALEAGSAWLALPLLATFIAGWFAPTDSGCDGRTRVIATLTLLLALGFEPLSMLFGNLPVVGWVAPARWAAISALFVPLAAMDALHAAPRAARAAVLVTLIAAGVATVATPARERPRAVEPPTNELIEFDALPAVELAAGALELAGWVDAQLGVDEVRLIVIGQERGDERFEFGLDLSSEPWTDQDVAKQRGPGTWFRASGLDVAHLEEGTYELRVALARAGRTLDEFSVASCVLERRPRPSPRTWLFFAVTLIALWGRRVRAPFVLAIVLAQAAGFAWHKQPLVPRSEVFPQTQTEKIVVAELGHGRFLADPGVLPPSTGWVRGLASIQGYDALDVHRFNALRPHVMRASSQPLLGWNARGIDLERKIATLLGVSVLVTRTAFEQPGFELVASPSGLPRRAETWIQRRLDRRFERAFCVARTVSRSAALADLESFDPRAVAFVVDRDVTLESPFEQATVDFVRDEPECVELAAELDGDGLLVLCDTWFPGWVVTVDDEPAELLCVDEVLRGVQLTAGRHRVEFLYRPLSFRVGLALSGAAFLALGVVASLLRRRAQPPSTSRA